MKNSTLGGLAALLVLVVAFMIICNGPGYRTVGSTPQNLDQFFGYEIISVDNSYGIGRVKVKITSRATREILRARITCIALDASGKEVDFANWYAIKAAEGLSPGESSYYEWLFDDPIPSAVSYRFKVTELDWQ